MRILADENIPYVEEAFARIGSVRTVAGRSMTASDVAGADVLLVRSVTRVDAALLDACDVRFVGTATIGMDHVDRAYLASRGIPFANAAGSNANSVAEYVVAQLLTLGEQLGIDWAGKTLGVVGVGNIGKLAVRNAEAMGMRVLQNDPPRARAEGAEAFVDLDTVCAECDVITLHTPLIREGVDRTVHLFDRDRIDALRPDAILLNSGRGVCVDNQALLDALAHGRIAGACLDVWENEPTISIDLLDQVLIGTAHIAGYSFDGKVAGTKMLFDEVCRQFGLDGSWDPAECLPAPAVPQIEIDATGRHEQSVLHEIVRAVYDIQADDADLRGMAELPIDERGRRFDQLRKVYPVRREFFNTRVALTGGSAPLRDTLRTWGFHVEA